MGCKSRDIMFWCACSVAGGTKSWILELHPVSVALPFIKYHACFIWYISCLCYPGYWSFIQVERRTNSELRSIINNQREEMDGLSKQVQETEQAQIKDQEENRKKQAELEKKVKLLLRQNGQSWAYGGLVAFGWHSSFAELSWWKLSFVVSGQLCCLEKLYGLNSGFWNVTVLNSAFWVVMWILD